MNLEKIKELQRNDGPDDYEFSLILYQMFLKNKLKKIFKTEDINKIKNLIPASLDFKKIESAFETCEKIKKNEETKRQELRDANETFDKFNEKLENISKSKSDIFRFRLSYFTVYGFGKTIFFIMTVLVLFLLIVVRFFAYHSLGQDFLEKLVDLSDLLLKSLYILFVSVVLILIFVLIVILVLEKQKQSENKNLTKK